MDFLNFDFIYQLLLSTIRMATPLLIVAIAELYSEKGGLVNIGLDEAYGLGKYNLEDICNEKGREHVFMDWLNKLADHGQKLLKTRMELSPRSGR